VRGNDLLCRGGSNITDQDGSPLAEIWDREGIILADVEPAGVIEHRASNPWFTGHRPDLYV
jgi:predicted amidohydrolase